MPRDRLRPVLLLLLLPLISLSACSSGAVSQQPSQQPVVAESTSETVDLARVAEPLRDPAWPGIPLKEALSRAGRQVPLPESTDTITKVLFFEAPDGSAGFWLSILYSSAALSCTSALARTISMISPNL